MTTQRQPFDKPVDVLEKNVLLAYAAYAAVGLGPILFALASVFPPGILGIHLTVVGALLAIASAWRNPRPKRRRARVRADDQGVWADGKLVVSRAKIADGFFQPRPGRDRSKASSYGSSVRLVDKRGRIVFEAETDEEEAIAVLRALGLDAGSKRAVFNGSSPMFATLFRNLAFMLGSMAGMFGLIALLAAVGLVSVSGAIPPLSAIWFVAAMLPSKISVGIDGVHTRWLWWKRLVPMTQIASVQRVADREIKLHLTDGSERTIYTSMRSKHQIGASYASQHCDAVVARIHEAQAAFRARTPAADVSALVGKGTRTREEWRAALDKLRDAEPGYREAAVRAEDLWRVVEDPSAPADARAGAALLLRRSLDDEGKARVRVAAESTASPKLRIALDAAAGDTDGALDAALEELAEDAERERQA